MKTLWARLGLTLAVLTLLAAGAAPTSASGLRFTAITVGSGHACAITAQGRAYCWGSNYAGQLGDGTTTVSGVNGPQAVIGGYRFASISTHEYHTCALTAQGKAYCWGENYAGELGDGTTTVSGVNGPQAVIGGLRFTKVVTGEGNTCALTARGNAYCWGSNYAGGLGDGTTADSGVKGPQAVIGGLKFTDITAGENTMCATTAQGKAYCWGENYAGGLGDGTTAASGVKGPQAVIGGIKFSMVATSISYHSCALTARGNAYCWGSNYAGELGDGTTAASGVKGPQAVIGGLKFTSIIAGYHTCALTARGKAYCWGPNGSGELGNGVNTPSGVNGPQAVSGNLKFEIISAGESTTCALTAQGRAYCWGYNGDGVLGDGTLVDSNVPVAVQ